MRGYFGIGVFHPKHEENIGTLWRSAHAFGASFIFTIGKRYKKQASDTTKANRHIPLFEYSSLEDFENHKPYSCETICVELDDRAESLHNFQHPQRAVYLLGAEDYGLPVEYMNNKKIIYVPSAQFCLNVSTAGSIVLYDRTVKTGNV